MQAPTGTNAIPAMTTDAERQFYYRLAQEAAPKGAIIEFGAWLGASTAYIAAGIRDSGVQRKAIVFDKFQSKPGHLRKVEAFYSKHGIDKAPVGPCVETFRQNLGPLMEYVEPRAGQIEQTVNTPWADNSIALVITDAPKRVPAISTVLTALRNALQVGAVMAWQDFCHFPSYEIPACLYRLRDHLGLVDAIVPGTTLAFRLKSQWAADEVSLDALALGRWTPDEIATAWGYWQDFVPAEKWNLFLCGAAMFMCDIGHPAEAASWLRQVDRSDDVVRKWEYLREARPDFLKRYARLFDVMSAKEAA